MTESRGDVGKNHRAVLVDMCPSNNLSCRKRGSRVGAVENHG